MSKPKTEANAQDRLQPSLLDRLTDDDATNPKEPVEARVLTRARMRAAVLRDLSWLFNATRQQPEDPQSSEAPLWQECVEARRSVINYGLPAFSGATLSAIDFADLREAIRQAITVFEPRIDPASLDVDVALSGPLHAQHNIVRLVIRGHLWSQPVPLELLLQTDVDVETGLAQVRDMKV